MQCPICNLTFSKISLALHAAMCSGVINSSNKVKQKKFLENPFVGEVNAKKKESCIVIGRNEDPPPLRKPPPISTTSSAMMPPTPNNNLELLTGMLICTAEDSEARKGGASEWKFVEAKVKKNKRDRFISILPPVLYALTNRGLLPLPHEINDASFSLEVGEGEGVCNKIRKVHDVYDAFWERRALAVHRVYWGLIAPTSGRIQVGRFDQSLSFCLFQFLPPSPPSSTPEEADAYSTSHAGDNGEEGCGFALNVARKFDNCSLGAAASLSGPSSSSSISFPTSSSSSSSTASSKTSAASSVICIDLEDSDNDEGVTKPSKTFVQTSAKTRAKEEAPPPAPLPLQIHRLATTAHPNPVSVPVTGYKHQPYPHSGPPIPPPRNQPQQLCTNNNTSLGQAVVTRGEGCTVRSGSNIDESEVVSRLSVTTPFFFDTFVDLPADPAEEVVAVRRLRVIDNGFVLGWVSVNGRTMDDQNPIVQVQSFPTATL